ncbi:MAG: MotA/TolQ/ExbB proton channel [Gemmatimonadetes bacterium]|nr:MotA/TolQ/ExbB proton channel [Gemmatimonadota bacterium]
MQLSMTDIWAQTGWFARVIIVVLILMSIISLSVAVAKWIRFRRMATATRAFAPAFSQALENDNIAEALAAADQYTKSHVARVLGESLREVAPLLNDPRVAGAAINSAERSVEREQILLANDLKSGLGMLATIGATAPFVGLLGTTMGIINAFSGMATSGGGLEAISAGISEALITTAIGLMAAIPAVWLYNYFTARLDTLFSELAYAGREMIDWMMDRQAKREAGLPARAAGASH